MNPTLKNLLFWMVILVIGVVIWNVSTQFGPRDKIIMFSEFVGWVDTGQIASVTITGNEIRGTTRAKDTFRTYAPSYDNLVPRLLDKGVQIDVKPGGSQPWASAFFSWALMLALAWAIPLAVLAVVLAMSRRIARMEDKLDALLRRGDAPGGP